MAEPGAAGGDREGGEDREGLECQLIGDERIGMEVADDPERLEAPRLGRPTRVSIRRHAGDDSQPAYSAVQPYGPTTPSFMTPLA
jgi:hypothetical protein